MDELEVIQMKKHDSYEEPPNKPFFRNSRKTKPSTPPSEKSSDSNLTISPGKHVLMQGQLIDQISKLHDLLERGAISKVQYDNYRRKSWLVLNISNLKATTYSTHAGNPFSGTWKLLIS